MHSSESSNQPEWSNPNINREPSSSHVEVGFGSWLFAEVIVTHECVGSFNEGHFHPLYRMWLMIRSHHGERRSRFAFWAILTATSRCVECKVEARIRACFCSKRTWFIT